MAARVAFTPKEEDGVDEDDGRDVKAVSLVVLNSTSSWEVGVGLSRPLGLGR